MVKKLAEIDAESRSGLVCPKCFKEGLIAAPELEEQFDDRDKAIIHASGCSNRECKYHPESPGANAIPASEIKKQYSGASSGRISLSNLNLPGSRTVGVVMTLGLAFLLIIGMPFLGGTTGTGGGTASAQEVSVNDSSPMVDSVETNGNWTVYQTEGGYIVATEISGEVVYLTPDGDIARTPHLFQSQQGAIEAIQTWRDSIEAGGPGPILGPNSTTGPETGTPIINNTGDISPDPLNLTALEIYEYDGDFVVSGSVNGSVVYLTPAGNLSTSPYFFDNRTVASNYYLEYISQNGLNETADGIEIDPVPEDILEDDLQGIDRQAGETPSDVTEIPGEFNDSNFTVPDYVSDDGYTIEGEVITGEEKHPNATVYLQSTPRSSQVKDDGSYAFTNVQSGDHRIWVEPENDHLAATTPINVSVTENGSLEVHESADNALFIETEDGTVSGNTLTLLTQPARNISFAGEGANLSTSLTFENTANADSLNVTLEPVKKEETVEKEMPTLVAGSETFAVGGTVKPVDQRLTISGSPSSEMVAKTGTLSGSKTFYTNGNLLPRQASLTLTGTANVTNRSASGSGSDVEVDMPVSGNILRDLTVTVEGKTLQEHWEKTLAGKSSYSLDIPGNLSPADTVLSVSGRESRTDKTKTGEFEGEKQILKNAGNKLKNINLTLYGNTDVSSWNTETYRQASRTVSIPGNLPPKNPRMDLSGNVNEFSSQTSNLKLNGQTADVGLNVIDRKKTGNLKQGETTNFEINSKAGVTGYNGDSTPKIVLTGQQPQDVKNIDYSSSGGGGTETKIADIYTSGTYYIDYNYTVEVFNHICSGANEVTVSLGTERHSGTFVKHHLASGGDRKYRSGSPVTSTYLESGDSLWASRDRYQPCTISEPRVYSQLGVDKMWREPDPDPATLTVNGNTHDIGSLSPGETKTVEVPGLKHGENAVSLDSGGWAEVDYEIRWGKQVGLARETTIDNPGNIGAEVDVTLDGKKSVSSYSKGNSLHGGDSFSVDIGGNVDPTGPATGNNPELDLSGNQPLEDMSAGGRVSGLGNGKTVWTAPQDGTYRITASGSYSFEGGTCLWGSIHNNANTKATAGGKQILSHYADATSGHVSEWSWNRETVSLDKGDKIKLDMAGTMCDDYDWGSGHVSLDSVMRLEDIGNTEVTVNGKDYDLGQFGDGDQRTIPLSNLSPGSTTVSISTYGGSSDIYANLNWNEVSKTDSPSLTIDGDEICSASGPTVHTKTCTVSAENFSPGSHDLVAASKGLGFDYTLSYTPKTVTKGVNVTVGDSGSNPVEHSGYLGPEESLSTKLPEIENGQQTISVSHDEGPAPSWNLSATTRTAVKAPELTFDGDSPVTNLEQEYLREGQTISRNLTELAGSSTIPSPDGTHSISLNSANDMPVGYKINWTSLHETKNPVINISGKTTANRTISGSLGKGETSHIDINGLTNGSHKLTVSSEGPLPHMEFSTKTRTAPSHPVVSLSGHSSKERRGPALLKQNKSMTVTLSELIGDSTLTSHSRSHTLNIETANDVAIDYSLSWADVSITETPEVTAQDSVYCRNTSTFTGRVKCDIPRETFQEDSGVTLSTVSGPVKYNFTYLKRVGPEQFSMSLNGHDYTYPEDFPSAAQPLKEDTWSHTVSGLEHGNNTLEVSVDQVEGLTPGIMPTLTYNKVRKTTSVPTITVTKPSGVKHQMNLTSIDGISTNLSETTSLSLPSEWFGKGENTIKIVTADGTPIIAQVNGTSLHRQTGLLN